MNILVSNDDGIHSQGIKALVYALKGKGHSVYVSAPKTEQSGTGHGVTLHRPLRVEECYRDDIFFGYSIDGTPSDCVKLGYWGIFKDIKFDIMISGINKGVNLGSDVLYSGTVSAAAEAALLGLKSVAVSLEDNKSHLYFDTAANFVTEYIEKIIDIKFPMDTLININVPNLKKEDILGYRYTTQGDRKYRDEFIERTDPRGNKYYWLGGEAFETVGEDFDSIDFNVLKKGLISITPLNLNLTDKDFLDRIKEI